MVVWCQYYSLIYNFSNVKVIKLDFDIMAVECTGGVVSRTNMDVNSPGGRRAKLQHGLGYTTFGLYPNILGLA